MESSATIPDSDEQLVERLAAGDRAALTELVRRHQATALRVAYHTLGHRAQAEDIAQEAFLRIWRGAGDYRAQASFRSWFYRIIVNLCLDTKRRRSAGSIEGLDITDHRQTQPQSVLMNSERRESVRRVVAGLADRQRLALVLHKYGDMSIQQVQEATGWTDSAVESLLVRAYATLRRELAADDDASKSTAGNQAGKPSHRS